LASDTLEGMSQALVRHEATTPVGVNGFGRVANGLLALTTKNYLSGGSTLLTDVVNLRTDRTDSELDGLAAGLETDAVYGRSPSIIDVISIPNQDWRGQNRIPVNHFERAMRVVTPGGEHVVRLTSGDNPAHSMWDSYGVKLVFDATGNKKGNPRDHVLSLGGAELAIVTSPFDGIPTFISGVNASEAAIISALESEDPETKNPNRTFATSSCSTGAISTVLGALLGEGMEMEMASAEVTHALTQSDAAIDNGHGQSALHTRRSSSGSQREVSRILGSMGYAVPFLADSTRVLEQTGSVASLTLVIKGIWTSDLILETFGRAIKNRGLHDHLGIEERRALDAWTIRGDERTAVVDARSIQTARMNNGDTLATLKAWFDNERGYVANVLRLASSVLAAHRQLEPRSHGRAVAQLLMNPGLYMPAPTVPSTGSLVRS